jgi:sugar phosphate isomerase/epimerase
MVRFGTDTEPRRMLPEEDASRYQSSLAANLQRLIDLAADRFVLCVENYKLDPLIFDVLQPHLTSGGLFLCWDIAKTYLGRSEPDRTLEEFFWRNLAHVRQVHLHDLRDGVSHRVIGTGHVDFMRFLPRLADANVLEYCIEVRPREKATESLTNLRRMIGNRS